MDNLHIQKYCNNSEINQFDKNDKNLSKVTEVTFKTFAKTSSMNVQSFRANLQLSFEKIVDIMKQEAPYNPAIFR